MTSLRGYIARRLVQFVPMVFFVMIINFLLIHTAPGDPAVILSGASGGLVPSEEYVNNLREKWGLNEPLHVQLTVYLSNVLRGDLGHSLRFNKPVLDVILDRLPLTLVLVVGGLLFGFVAGTLTGTYAARHRGAKVDHAFSVGSTILLSLPVFWLGIILILIFSVSLALLPAGGTVSPLIEPGTLEYQLDKVKHAILPVAAMALWSFPSFHQVTRSSVASVLKEDYVTTHRAAGFEEGKILRRYVLKNAMLPVITIAGLWLGFAFTGALLIENVFSWPGIGRLLWESATSRDYPMLMGIFLVSSILIYGVQWLTDVTYAWLDPRIRY